MKKQPTKRIAVFFLSWQDLSSRPQLRPGAMKIGSRWAYVRTEIHDLPSVEDGLDILPRVGESLMNAHEVPSC
jgi:hypothetical protein